MMGHWKIGLALLAVASIGLGYFSITGKSAAEKWHAEGELNPKADFSINDKRPLLQPDTLPTPPTHLSCLELVIGR